MPALRGKKRLSTLEGKSLATLSTAILPWWGRAGAPAQAALSQISMAYESLGSIVRRSQELG